LLAFLVAAAGAAAAAEIRCASAESMAGLMDAWTSGFSAEHPASPARVTRREQFSAAAFEALLRGEVDVVPFSRELFAAEHAAYAAKFGGAPRLIPVATGSRATKGGTHAIAIFVHERNPLTRLSLNQLREVFGRGGSITTWGQLGLTGEWAARKISLHGMVVRRETGNPPGIVNFLEQRLLAGRGWRDGITAHADVANGPQGLELIVRAVAADESAIGYSGFAYAQPGTKTLALAETDSVPYFAGTANEVSRRDYLLTRTIYLCVRDDAGETARAFVDYVTGPAGQQAITRDAVGFFPLAVNTEGSPVR
jgi:phosphate transport system substrate-binding protein